MLTHSEFTQILLKKVKQKAFRCQKDIRFVITQNVAELAKKAAEELPISRNFFLSRRYIDAFCQSEPENMTFACAAAYKEDKMVFFTFLQFFDFEGKDLKNPMANEESQQECAIGKIKEKVSGMLFDKMGKKNLRLMICGQTFVSGDYACAFAPEIPSAQAAKILHTALKKAAKEYSAKIILVKDFSDNFHCEVKNLGYHAFCVDPNMLLHCRPEWHSFDDYLAAMSTKYRTRAKSAFNKSEKLISKNLPYDEILLREEKIYELYAEIHDRADFKIGKVSPHYFSLMKKNLHDNFFVKAYFLDNELVGFASCFIFDKKIDAHFVGFDEELNKKYALYQRILYDFVQCGIENGCENVSFGRTALEIKSTVGAVAEELICLVRLQNSVSNRLIKHVFDYMKPSEWTPRSPFREENSEKKTGKEVPEVSANA
jgi:hypothetical protein